MMGKAGPAVTGLADPTHLRHLTRHTISSHFSSGSGCREKRPCDGLTACDRKSAKVKINGPYRGFLVKCRHTRHQTRHNPSQPVTRVGTSSPTYPPGSLSGNRLVWDTAPLAHI